MLIVGQKERCGDWAKARIGVATWGDWYEAFGWEKGGELIAAAVYTNFSGPDISLHIAAIPGKRWLRREALKAVFRYAFVQLGVRRITGYVPLSNKDAIRFDLHLGFHLEGEKRNGWWDGNMLVLGMLKEECRYL